MKRGAAKVLLIIANLLMLLSILIPAVSTATSNVIGGADWPTFRMYFRETLWLGVIGVILWICAVVALMPRKK